MRPTYTISLGWNLKLTGEFLGQSSLVHLPLWYAFCGRTSSQRYFTNYYPPFPPPIHRPAIHQCHPLLAGFPMTAIMHHFAIAKWNSYEVKPRHLPTSLSLAHIECSCVPPTTRRGYKCCKVFKINHDSQTIIKESIGRWHKKDYLIDRYNRRI